MAFSQAIHSGGAGATDVQVLTSKENMDIYYAISKWAD